MIENIIVFAPDAVIYPHPLQCALGWWPWQIQKAGTPSLQLRVIRFIINWTLSQNDIQISPRTWVSGSSLILNSAVTQDSEWYIIWDAIELKRCSPQIAQVAECLVNVCTWNADKYWWGWPLTNNLQKTGHAMCRPIIPLADRKNDVWNIYLG